MKAFIVGLCACMISETLAQEYDMFPDFLTYSTLIETNTSSGIAINKRFPAFRGWAGIQSPDSFPVAPLAPASIYWWLWQGLDAPGPACDVTQWEPEPLTALSGGSCIQTVVDQYGCAIVHENFANWLMTYENAGCVSVISLSGCCGEWISHLRGYVNEPNPLSIPFVTSQNFYARSTVFKMVTNPEITATVEITVSPRTSDKTFQFFFIARWFTLLLQIGAMIFSIYILVKMTTKSSWPFVIVFLEGVVAGILNCNSYYWQPEVNDNLAWTHLYIREVLPVAFSAPSSLMMSLVWLKLAAASNLSKKAELIFNVFTWAMSLAMCGLLLFAFERIAYVPQRMVQEPIMKLLTSIRPMTLEARTYCFSMTLVNVSIFFIGGAVLMFRLTMFMKASGSDAIKRQTKRMILPIFFQFILLSAQCFCYGARVYYSDFVRDTSYWYAPGWDFVCGSIFLFSPFITWAQIWAFRPSSSSSS